MNTRVSLSFLLLALLVGVCCAARCQDPPALPEPVLAVQRCFPQATVRPLPEVRYADEIAPGELTPFSSRDAGPISTISPDGKRLFFNRRLEAPGWPLWKSYFLDVTTGEASLAKMPEQIKLDEDMGIPYIATGVWDPLEPAYLYAMILDYPSHSIWRINVETLVATQILPPGINIFVLSDITPDGRYLLCDILEWEEGLYPAHYSLETHTWTPLAEPTYAENMMVRPTLAPNGELVAGFTCTEEYDLLLTIKDVTTDRLVHTFNKQVLPGTHLHIGYAPTWLPDSAGLLVNMYSMTGRRLPTATIGQLSINGEAVPIATGVEVIANSQNGRHWLLQHDQQFYILTVDDTPLEE